MSDGVQILRFRAMIMLTSAIEPTLGPMKMYGRLGRNPLRDAIGDAVHAALCGVGHNIRLLLRMLPLFKNEGITQRNHQ